MPEKRRGIFRPEAIRRYAEARERSVLPRAVAPRTLVFLWLIFCLLVGAGALAWWTPVPIVASGVAVVLDGQAAGAAPNELILVAILPAEDLPKLAARPPLTVQLDSATPARDATILRVGSQVVSPDALHGIVPAASLSALGITRPSAIATVRLDLPSGGLPASAFAGSAGLVRVRLGTKRAASLLPVVGHLVGA